MPRSISELHSARRLMLSGKPREALEQVAPFEMQYATLSIVRGECHYVLGEWPEAVREFENALRLSPNSPRAEIMLELASEMIVLLKTMRMPATIEQLVGVTNESPEAPTIPKLSFSREIDTGSPEATVSTDEIGLVSETLADLMIGQGKFDEARKVYIQLSRLNPDRYEYFRDKIKNLADKTSE